MLLKHTQSGSQ